MVTKDCRRRNGSPSSPEPRAWASIRFRTFDHAQLLLSGRGLWTALPGVVQGHSAEYPGGTIGRLDRRQHFATVGAIPRSALQNRPRDVYYDSALQQVLVASMAEYGYLDGALTTYDPQTGARRDRANSRPDTARRWPRRVPSRAPPSGPVTLGRTGPLRMSVGVASGSPQRQRCLPGDSSAERASQAALARAE
jgi:hypothetical protein